MPTARWMDQAKTAPVHDVFEACGIGRIGKKGYGPCPICGSEKRGSHDRRGAIALSQGGSWKCWPCGASGDSLDVVSQVCCGRRLREADEDGRGSVRSWFSSRGWCDSKDDTPPSCQVSRDLEEPEAPVPDNGSDLQPKYPPKGEVLKFWSSCQKINGNLDDEIKNFFATRRWDPGVVAESKVCRISPGPQDLPEWPSWWPRGRASTWRILVPAFTSDGTIASIHGRSTKVGMEPGTPKVLWPRDHDASDLIMADIDGWRFLAGKMVPKIVVICEGITDLIAVSVHKKQLGKNVAILACASGGFRALSQIRWPKWVRVFCATDPDPAGDLYAREIATSISPTPLYRLPLR